MSLNPFKKRSRKRKERELERRIESAHEFLAVLWGLEE